MNKERFKKLLYRTVAVPVVLLALLAAVLLLETHYLRISMQWVDHTDQVIGVTRQLLKFTVDAETGLRGFLVTGDEHFLEPYRLAQQNRNEKLGELQRLVADNADQVRRLTEFDQTYYKWEQYASGAIKLRREGGGYADTGLSLQGKQLMDSLRRQQNDFLDVEEGLRNIRVRRADWASRLVSATCIILSLAIGLFIALFTRRQLRSLAAKFQEALDTAETRASSLAQSEQRWVTTLTSIGDAVIATDAQGGITFMNDLAQRLSGWTLQDASGRPSDEIFKVVNEESGETIENPVTRAIRLNRVVELANHAVLLARGGSRVPVEDSAAPILDCERKMIGVVLVFRDVTEKRRRERERTQALFNEKVSRKMAEETATKLRRIQAVTDVALSQISLDELLNQLMQRTCDALLTDMAVVLLTDEQNQVLRVRAALGLEGEVAQRIDIPVGKGMSGIVAKTGRLRIVDNLAEVEVYSPIVRACVASLIAAPLVVDGRVIGVMHVDSATPRKFTEDEADLLQLVADRVALAIDRTRREDELRKVTRTLKALNNSNQALLRITDEDELVRSVCDIVTQDCGYSMVWIGYAEDDEYKTVRPVAHAGFEEGYLESLKLTWADTERGRGPTGTAIRTGKPCSCADMLNDPAFEPWRAEAAKRGYASSAVFPMMEEGRAFGALTIYSKQSNAFSQDEMKLLAELADDLAYGIRTLRARRAQAQAEIAAAKASEQRRLALEGAELGSWEVLLDSGEVFWDERCRNTFGVFEGDTIGYDEAIARIHADDRPGTDEAVKRAIAGVDGGAYHWEFRTVWPDGSVHWVASHGRAYFEGEGDARRAVRFIGVNMDISSQKQSEEALRASEQRWATTLSSIGDAVISTDAAGKIVFMNDVAQQLTGWTKQEAKGKQLDIVFDITNEATRTKPESPVAKVIRMNQVVGLANHTVLIRRDGSEIPIDDSAAPIRGNSGEIEGVVLVFRDVSERKRTEELLRNSERLAITGRMAASIAHEIHNPLDAVGNLLYIIQDGADAESTRKYAAMAATELGRVVQMTKHMLAFNREAHKPLPLRIGEILETVTELYSRKIEMAGISMDTNVEFGDEIAALPSELRQVFANLVGNAIEAVGKKGKIRLHVFASRDWKRNRPGLRVVIADNGHGVPKEIRDKIFDPFYTTKGESGTGLGLWITSGIVEKHEGMLRMWSSTRVGRSGTCFSVFLPLESASKSVKAGA